MMCFGCPFETPVLILTKIGQVGGIRNPPFLTSRGGITGNRADSARRLAFVSHYKAGKLGNSGLAILRRSDVRHETERFDFFSFWTTVAARYNLRGTSRGALARQ